MQTLEALRHKIMIAEELQLIVKTMKILAAVNIQQCERAVASLAKYSQTIELGLQIVLRNGLKEPVTMKPERSDHLGVIIFGSDQGMCGRFNEQIATYAMAQINELRAKPAEQTILAIGTRLSGFLEDKALPIEAYFTVPGSIAGITPLVQEVLVKMDLLHVQQRVDQIIIFYNKPLSNSTHAPHIQRFWPVDPEWLLSLKEKGWPSRVLPLFTMEREALFASLIRQHLFVSLYRACAESLTSENISRLASMQAAEGNIADRLDQLNLQFRHQRQSDITEELLDIIAGFEALTVQQR